MAEFYRFRSIDSLLGKHREFEEQTIYFANPEELNDPMEGLRDIVWNGDKIVWTNFFKHYVFCLNRSYWLLNMTVSDILQTLESQGIISQDCSRASEEIRRSYRNDVHHMNPPVAEIDFPNLAKKNIHNLAVIEREIWDVNFKNGAMIPIQPKYWDINPDGTITVDLRGGF